MMSHTFCLFYKMASGGKEAFAHQFEFGPNYIWYHDFLP